MARIAAGRVAIALLVVAALVTVAPGVALASCAEQLGLNLALVEAETAFVGEVVELDFAGRVAGFEVIEVWKGEVPEQVTVNGGPDMREMLRASASGTELHTSVDRTYAFGETYLVYSYGSDGALLLDNGCSSTQPFTSDLESFRPVTASSPRATVEADALPLDEAGGAGWAIPAIVAIVAMSAAGMVGLAIRRKRERDDAIW